MQSREYRVLKVIHRRLYLLVYSPREMEPWAIDWLGANSLWSVYVSRGGGVSKMKWQ